MYEPADRRLEDSAITFEPQTLAGWIQAMTEREVYETTQYALSDCSTEFGDFQRAIANLADEYENWPKRSSTFDSLAGEFMHQVIAVMDGLREGES